jgi:integrase
MPRVANRLTARKVETTKTPARLADGLGLYLIVEGEFSKNWMFEYQFNGKRRYMGLGSALDVSLADAREKRNECRKLKASGIDPLEARRDERAARAAEDAKRLTFEEAARRYFDGHQSKWTNAKHRAQFLSTLQEYVFPVFGGMPIAMIDTTLVLKVIEPIWKTKTVTANRIRSRIETVLGWATVSGYRTGDNPAKWRGHLAAVLPGRSSITKVEHHAAMPYPEVPSFVAALAKRKGIDARALEFLILCAARSGEVTGARWSEIDLNKKVWTIPAQRMKGRKDHTVPLAPRAIEILRTLPREGELVFVGTRKGCAIDNKTLGQSIKAEGYVVHGFRSSFRDWAAERTSFPRELAEEALAHAVGDATERAYRRTALLEKRRRMMDAWADYCAKPAPAVKAGDNVVAMGAG